MIKDLEKEYSGAPEEIRVNNNILNNIFYKNFIIIKTRTIMLMYLRQNQVNKDTKLSILFFF
jgi:hypothetical protein